MPTLTPTGNFTPTSVRVIGQALRDRVVSKGVCTADQFRVVVRDPSEVKPIAGDFDVLFALGDETPDERVRIGGGRTVNKRDRRATLVVRSRLLLDSVDEAGAQLFDPDDGHLRLEDAVCDALELFQPATEAGDWLVTEPITLNRLTRPRKLAGSEGWVYSEWEVSFSYIRTLDNSIV